MYEKVGHILERRGSSELERKTMFMILGGKKHFGDNANVGKHLNVCVIMCLHCKYLLYRTLTRQINYARTSFAQYVEG